MTRRVAFALGVVSGTCCLVLAQIAAFYVTEAHNRKSPRGSLEGERL